MRLAIGALLWASAGVVAAQNANPPANDIPKSFEFPAQVYDFARREVMIPMRDGVKLFTEILVPNGARNAPMLLTRTPYNAHHRTRRNNSARMLATLPQGDDVFVEGGYIRVFQDIRGKYRSEGEYVTHTTPSNGW